MCSINILYNVSDISLINYTTPLKYHTNIHSIDYIYTEIASFIRDNPRGYGYWIWKPYLNYKVINSDMSHEGISNSILLLIYMSYNYMLYF